MFNIKIITSTSRNGMLASAEVARLKMPKGDITLVPENGGYTTHMATETLSPAVIISLMKMVEDETINWAVITGHDDEFILNCGNQAMPKLDSHLW